MELLATCFVIISGKFLVHKSKHFMNTAVAAGKEINEIDFMTYRSNIL